MNEISNMLVDAVCARLFGADTNAGSCKNTSVFIGKQFNAAI